MAVSLYTAEQLSTLSFLAEIDLLKKEADSYRPLPKETEERILQKFRLEWNYHSNAIEGNKLTYGETVAFLMEGLTAKGKPLKDHLDIQGHDEAVKSLIALVKDKDYLLTEADIRNLHKLILKEPYWSDAKTVDGVPTKKEIKIGQYKSTPNHVRTPTNEIHYYAAVEDTPIKMGELMEFYQTAKGNASIHPLILATLFHHEFTSIHPFDDGNGRMGRLLMNLMLMQEGYPPIVVKQGDRLNYYQVLRQADAGELIPIVEYMSELLKHSLSIYVKGAKGESIEEEDDIDKEIALFKKGLEQDKIKYKRNEDLVEKAIKESIIPFFSALFVKLDKFEDLFIEVKKVIDLKDSKYIKGQQSIEKGFSNIEAIFLNVEKSVGFALFEEKAPSGGDYNIASFDIMITFDGYKKSKIGISQNLRYVIRFNDYDYSIFRDGGNSSYILQEPYGQIVSKEKINEACTKEVRGFLENLRRYS